MYSLATPAELGAALGLAPEAGAEDERLTQALTAATAHIERATGRRFIPRLASLAHDLRHPYELPLREDLLQLTRLRNGDGRDIDPGVVQTLPADSGGAISVLRLRGGARFRWQGSPLAAIEVQGLWGWHERWSLAWQEVTSSRDDPLTAAATTLQVADSSTIERGQLLRLGQEYLWVRAVDRSQQRLQVTRGAQGTSAADHPQGSAVARYQPPREVALLCLRLATWLHREPDLPAPERLPAGLEAELGRLRRLAVPA